MSSLQTSLSPDPQRSWDGTVAACLVPADQEVAVLMLPTSQRPCAGGSAGVGRSQNPISAAAEGKAGRTSISGGASEWCQDGEASGGGGRWHAAVYGGGLVVVVGGGTNFREDWADGDLQLAAPLDVVAVPALRCWVFQVNYESVEILCSGDEVSLFRCWVIWLLHFQILLLVLRRGNTNGSATVVNDQVFGFMFAI